MFDIGFPELILVSIIALLVIGPERLPETIRAVSLWIGRFRRTFTELKQEIENEIGADEIRAQLHNESVMKDLEKARESIDEVRDTVGDLIREVDQPAASAIGTIPTTGKPGVKSDDESSQSSA